MVVSDAKSSCGAWVEMISIDKSQWRLIGDSNMGKVSHLRFEASGGRRKC